MAKKGWTYYKRRKAAERTKKMWEEGRLSRELIRNGKNGGALGFCTQCGWKKIPQARFCGKCGVELCK